MHDRDIQWLYDRVQLQTKVIISRFHTSPEYEANKLGYRVVSLEWSKNRRRTNWSTYASRPCGYILARTKWTVNESENGIAK